MCDIVVFHSTAENILEAIVIAGSFQYGPLGASVVCDSSYEVRVKNA